MIVSPYSMVAESGKCLEGDKSDTIATSFRVSGASLMRAPVLFPMRRCVSICEQCHGNDACSGQL